MKKKPMVKVVYAKKYSTKSIALQCSSENTKNYLDPSEYINRIYCLLKLMVVFCKL